MSGYAEQLLQGRRRRKAVYLNAEAFIKAAAEYFQWCEDNPIQQEQVNVWQGNVIRTDLDKQRVFTKQGLCNHLGIPVSRLTTYKNRDDEQWTEAIDMIEQIIYAQKFEGGVAGTMNSGIIIRDLGLTEKQEVVSEVTDKTPGAAVDDQHLAIHIHPDDDDCLNLPRPLYSQAQIDAGIPFTPPAAD